MSISVVIPTYNQARYIGHSIHSAIAQTKMPAEIVVSDDASTDDTAEILEQLAATTGLISVHRHPHNLGIAKNVDWALRSAIGDYILRLDSDDVISPTALEQLSSALDADPEAAYSHGAVAEIDAAGNMQRIRRLARGRQQDAEAALRASLRGYRVAANLVMFRRSALEQVGYIRSSRNFAEDFNLSVRLADAGYSNVYVNDIIGGYRVWADLSGVRASRKEEELLGLREVFAEAIEPAFRRRNWSMRQVERSRRRLAVTHSGALDHIDDVEDRARIRSAVLQLSNGRSVKFVLALRAHGLGGVISSYRHTVQRSKILVKHMIYR